MGVRHLGNHVYLLLGLFAEATCMFLLWTARSQATILAVLACEGLAYAGFMVAGQTYLAARTTEANRGTVGGIYAMAAGLASTLSPFALGVVAERWSLRTVFAASGAILGTGFLLFAAGFLALRSRLREEHAGRERDEGAHEVAQSVSPLMVRAEKLVSNRDSAGREARSSWVAIESTARGRALCLVGGRSSATLDPVPWTVHGLPIRYYKAALPDGGGCCWSNFVLVECCVSNTLFARRCQCVAFPGRHSALLDSAVGELCEAHDLHLRALHLSSTQLSGTHEPRPVRTSLWNARAAAAGAVAQPRARPDPRSPVGPSFLARSACA